MNLINIFCEEELSDVDNLRGFYTKIHPNINKEFLLNEKNIIIYKNRFENQFNDLFNKPYLPLSLNEKGLLPYTINYEKKNEKYFPFTPGAGFENCLKDLGYLIVYISPCKVKLSSLKKENLKKPKFQVMDFSKNLKGKFKKEKKQRKFKGDDIRKKIKSKFHKTLKNIINKNLKRVGSKNLFDFFPQYFVKNITIKLNTNILNYTYEKLIKVDIAKHILKQKKSDIDTEKYNRNLNVLNYLNNNQKISINSLFNKIRYMKYLNF